jgi:hypothetical protein
MPALISSLDPRSQDFLDNAAYHRSLVDELDTRLAQAAEGGGEKARNKHTERGKLPARERIDRLVDPGTAFLELNALAAWDMYGGDAPSAGIVTGIGVVAGRDLQGALAKLGDERGHALAAAGEIVGAALGLRRENGHGGSLSGPSASKQWRAPQCSSTASRFSTSSSRSSSRATSRCRSTGSVSFS